MDPLDKRDQSWQTLRKAVDVADTARSQDLFDRTYQHLESRIDRIEARVQSLELEIIRKMEQMTSAWQALAKSVDLLAERVVTRPEFDSVKVVAYVSIVGSLGVAFYLVYVRG